MRLLYFTMGIIALRLLEYILVIYAEREPVLCDGGMEFNGHKVEMFRWL
jgi:hypothetical protein